MPIGPLHSRTSALCVLPPARLVRLSGGELHVKSCTTENIMLLKCRRANRYLAALQMEIAAIRALLANSSTASCQKRRQVRAPSGDVATPCDEGKAIRTGLYSARERAAFVFTRRAGLRWFRMNAPAWRWIFRCFRANRGGGSQGLTARYLETHRTALSTVSDFFARIGRVGTIPAMIPRTATPAIWL
jgi:hypothetical protein